MMVTTVQGATSDLDAASQVIAHLLNRLHNLNPEDFRVFWVRSLNVAERPDLYEVIALGHDELFASGGWITDEPTDPDDEAASEWTLFTVDEVMSY